MPKRKIHSYDIYSGHAWYVPGPKQVLILLLLLLAGTLLGSLIMLLMGIFYSSATVTEYGMLVSYPVMFIPPMLYVGTLSRRNSLFETGYSLDSRHFGRVGGFICAIMASVAVIAAAFMTDALTSLMPPIPEALEAALKSLTNGNLWVNILCVSIFAPVFEEWLCRGMVLRGLLNASRKGGRAPMSPAWAIVISALFFAVIHLNPWQAIPAFVLGCLFGYVYYRTGSLMLTMLMHCVNNTFALLCSRTDAFADAESWTEVLPAQAYWLVFAACALLLIMVVREFGKIPVQSPRGNCDPVSAE